MPEKLAVALVGVGRMGRIHARQLHRLPSMKVVCVADVNMTAARELAAEFDARASTVAEAISADDVTALVISTPTPSHEAIVLACIEAGKPVFVEKPLAHDLSASDRIVAAVNATGVPVQVGFQRRYDPAHQEARRQIDAGELGRIEGFRAVNRDTKAPPLDFLKTSGGIFVDLGIHDLDAARFFVGEVTDVHAVGGAITDPSLQEHGLFDTAVATLRFASGAVGTIECALNSPWGYDIRTEVIGSSGRVTIDMDSRHLLKRYERRGIVQDRPSDFAWSYAEAYSNELEAFAFNILEGNPVAPTVIDGRESLRLALAAQRSLETGESVRVRDVH